MHTGVPSFTNASSHQRSGWYLASSPPSSRVRRTTPSPPPTYSAPSPPSVIVLAPTATFSHPPNPSSPPSRAYTGRLVSSRTTVSNAARVVSPASSRAPTPTPSPSSSSSKHTPDVTARAPRVPPPTSTTPSSPPSLARARRNARFHPRSLLFRRARLSRRARARHRVDDFFARRGFLANAPLARAASTCVPSRATLDGCVDERYAGGDTRRVMTRRESPPAQVARDPTVSRRRARERRWRRARRDEGARGRRGRARNDREGERRAPRTTIATTRGTTRG